MSHLTPATPAGRRQRQTAIRKGYALLPSPTDAVDNLLALYAETDTQTQLDGAAWYSLAHDIAASLPACTTTAGAGIIAALSPQSSWGLNITNAHLVCDGEPTTQTSNAEDKAVAIYNGADPDDVLGGRKVRSFYRNIADPASPGPVTVDRHALCALFGTLEGQAVASTATVGRILERPGVYALTAACYRSAARRLGLHPHVLQATVWLHWRRCYAETDHSNNDPF